MAASMFPSSEDVMPYHSSLLLTGCSIQLAASATASERMSRAEHGALFMRLLLISRSVARALGVVPRRFRFHLIGGIGVRLAEWPYLWVAHRTYASQLRKFSETFGNKHRIDDCKNVAEKYFRNLRKSFTFEITGACRGVGLFSHEETPISRLSRRVRPDLPISDGV